MKMLASIAIIRWFVKYRHIKSLLKNSPIAVGAGTFKRLYRHTVKVTKQALRPPQELRGAWPISGYGALATKIALSGAG